MRVMLPGGTNHKGNEKCLEGNIPEVGVAAMGGVCDFVIMPKKRTELTLRH